MLRTCAGAQEQLPGRLFRSRSVGDEPRDLAFLRGEQVERVGRRLARTLAAGGQFTGGSRREPGGTDGGQFLVRDAQVVPGVAAAGLAAQPLPVDQVCPGEVHRGSRAFQPVDRFSVMVLGPGAVAEQGT
jgi:hypothetical protein